MRGSFGWIALFLWITLPVSGQTNISFVSQLDYPFDLNDVWGYADDQGREYALVGTYRGVSIVNVTDPAKPEELFFIDGPRSTWRDLKTWKKHAYVVHDNTADTAMGLLIIDLSNLPDTIDTLTYKGPLNLLKAHNLYIDENGYAYVFGSNIGVGGAFILDLANPQSPSHRGKYNQAYLHDGYVRNNLLIGSEIFDGQFSVVDVSDKNAPQLLATHETTFRYTHNAWLSDDGNTVFTTDEKSGAYIEAYDISDIDDITLLDKYRTSRATDVIPHNVHVFNDFLVNSYYTDGVTIVDASHPSRLLETGHYDISEFSGKGFRGCWGLYPFLPSGIILATNIEGNLVILEPTYVRAAFVEGTVLDSITGKPLKNVSAALVTDDTTYTVYTDKSGYYVNGTALSGTYELVFRADQCQEKRFRNIDLNNNDTKRLDVIMDCNTFISQNKLFLTLSGESGQTVIHYQTPVVKDTYLNIYNLEGKIMKVIPVTAKRGKYFWEGHMSPGMYIARFTKPGYSKSIKVIKYQH